MSSYATKIDIFAVEIYSNKIFTDELLMLELASIEPLY